MAESVREKVFGGTLSRVVNENPGIVECAVCLQTCIHPAELPCGHIFCYLCIKGIVNQGRRCAMCRQDIPVDYLDKPRLLKPVDAENSSQGFEDGHLWFYEGHNGWWQYDERTSLELESAYQKGERCCELLIAGFLYIADFDAMLQYRRNDPNRRRRIKRDLATTSKKGVAGLKASKDCSSAASSVPDLVSNELIQSLPITGQSIMNNLNSMRFVSPSDSNPRNSAQDNSEQSQAEPRGRNRHSSVTATHSTCNQMPQGNTNSTSQTDQDETFYSRNFDLDSIIHDTLDWTIEQIESLNLELLNDYEVLFRDVNNYGQLHDNLNRNRTGGVGNSYQNQFLNLGNRLSRSFENELDSTDDTTRLPSLSQSEQNSPIAGHSQSLEPNPGASRVSETGTETSQLSNLIPTAPQPPPRTRGMSRLVSRAVPPKRSTSLSRETLF